MAGSGADQEYARLLARSGRTSGAGADGALLSQLEDIMEINAPNIILILGGGPVPVGTPAGTVIVRA